MSAPVVFGLLVGWLGGWALARIFARMAMSSPMGRITRMVGGTLTVGWHFALARLVSWGCGLALALAGLWRVAQERTARGVYGVRVTLAPLPALRSTVDAGETADVVTLRVTREALWRWADAALAGDGAALDAGGVLVRVEWADEGSDGR